MQLQETICDQKSGSKLQFALNENSVILPHFTQNFKYFSGVLPHTRVVGGATPSRIHLLLLKGSSTPVRHRPSLTPHFQIPSAVYGLVLGWT